MQGWKTTLTSQSHIPQEDWVAALSLAPGTGQHWAWATTQGGDQQWRDTEHGLLHSG